MQNVYQSVVLDRENIFKINVGTQIVDYYYFRL